jgi:hypothetical protein
MHASTVRQHVLPGIEQRCSYEELNSDIVPYHRSNEDIGGPLQIGMALILTPSSLSLVRPVLNPSVPSTRHFHQPLKSYLFRCYAAPCRRRV